MNYYWTERTNEAVKEYILSTDHIIRSKIYREQLQPAILEMCEAILKRYFINNINTLSWVQIKGIIDDAEVFVVSKIEKYDVDSGKKSYSYFGTVIKNYYIDLFKSLHKQKLTLVDIDQFSDSVYEDFFIDDSISEVEYNFEFEELKIDAISLLKRKIQCCREVHTKEILVALFELYTKENDQIRFNQYYVALYIRKRTKKSYNSIVTALRSQGINIFNPAVWFTINKAFRKYDKIKKRTKNKDDIISPWEKEAIRYYVESKKKPINEKKLKIQIKKQRTNRSIKRTI